VSDDVWVVVPCFNEASVIAEVVGDLRSKFTHVVCVDDGSTDDTAAQAVRAGATLVRHPVNLGQGAALQTGVEYARRRAGARYFATFDADGQHRTEDLVVMIERLRTEPVDIVIGSRFASADTAKPPWFKRTILRVATATSRHARQLGLTDTHNGLRAFNRTVADRLDLTINGMGHASEFISLISENGWRVTEQSVDIAYTPYSRSRGQSILNGVNVLTDGLVRNRMRR